jgi:uncharacterized protein YsxB (DUF464 family)
MVFLMTKITISNKEITIQDHTLPIVCAAISSILQYMIREHDLDYEMDQEMITKVYIGNNKAKTTFKELMQELEIQYPDDIKVE